MPGGAVSGVSSSQPRLHGCYELMREFECRQLDDVQSCTYRATRKSPSYSSQPRADVVRYRVNGILNDICKSLQATKDVAEVRGYDVTLIHNETEGLFTDLKNSALGVLNSRLGLRAEPAANALAERILWDVRNTNSLIHLEAHSQGGIILRNALDRVRSELKLENQQDWEAFINKRLYINVIGSGTAMFDDIPKERIRFDDHTFDPVRVGTSLSDIAGRLARIPKKVQRWVKHGSGKPLSRLLQSPLIVSREVLKMQKSAFSALGQRPSVFDTKHGFQSYLAHDTNHATLDIVQDVKGAGDARQQGVEAAQLLIGQYQEGIIKAKRVRENASNLVRSSPSREFKNGLASELLRFSRKNGDDELSNMASEWLYGVIKQAPRIG